MLISEKIGKMPKGGLHNDALVTAGGGLAEGVYALLPDDQGGDKGGGGGQPTFPNGNGGQGSSFDELQDAPGGEAEKAANEAEWKVSVAQAAQAAKMHGKLSSGLRQFVTDALRPTPDWREVLRNFITQRARVEPSFARPKRRWLGEDLFLPDLSGEDMGELVIAVDCSGSTMVPHIINSFSTNTKAIHQDVKPSTTHVIYWDTRILGHDVFDRQDELTVELKGGGGTTFSQVVDHINQKGINPTCMVVLTDLYIGEFGPPLDFPVLWVSNGADTAPWGEVVKMDPRHL